MKLIYMFTVVCLVVLAGLVVAQSSAVTVQGTTKDRTGALLDGIGVRAVRSGQNVAETKSGPQGQYKLTLSSGSAFDLVFDEPAYQPAVLVALSGRDSHQISKVMLRQGEAPDVQAQLAADFARRYLETMRLR